MKFQIGEGEYYKKICKYFFSQKFKKVKRVRMIYLYVIKEKKKKQIEYSICLKDLRTSKFKFYLINFILILNQKDKIINIY